MISIINWPFLHYWLYAAFPHCYGLQNYLLKYLPYSQEWIYQMFGTDTKQEIIPVIHKVAIDGKEITIQMYRYHVEYRMDGKELYKPCISYHAIKSLDNDTFMLLLPIIDMFEKVENDYPDLKPDLHRILAQTGSPKEHLEDIVYSLDIGLLHDDGAEDAPLWYLRQETATSLYIAEWWPYVREFHLYCQNFLSDDIDSLNIYISVPEGEDAYLFGKRILSEHLL